MLRITVEIMIGYHRNGSDNYSHFQIPTMVNICGSMIFLQLGEEKLINLLYLTHSYSVLKKRLFELGETGFLVIHSLHLIIK